MKTTSFLFSFGICFLITGLLLSRINQRINTICDELSLQGRRVDMLQTQYNRENTMRI